MATIIELYEDRRSGWRVLTSQEGTTGYRFVIVDRVGRHTFAEDARELAHGSVPAGLEKVDLGVESEHGMDLSAPCAMWRRGRVQRTGMKLGVLTNAYVAGELPPAGRGKG
ncbi:MAG TPA: hypothetical protein VOB72_25645 [Candidatus Dormibacteraeota bacterium]|nr:hypothetical protein [Candidatus Dormibacteraeota bacterium]